MTYFEMKLNTLTSSLKVLKNASAILFIVATAGEGGQMIYESLRKAEGLVRAIDDGMLSNLYNKVFGVFLSGVPQQQISPDDYYAFLQRLGTLLDEANTQAHEVQFALREELDIAPY